MLKKSLMAVLLLGAAGIAAPALAQPIVVEERILERNYEPDGTMIEYVRVVHDDGSTVILRRVLSPERVVVTAEIPRWYMPRGTVTGGVGGAVGGRMILGVTPAYNIPLPVLR